MHWADDIAQICSHSHNRYAKRLEIVWEVRVLFLSSRFIVFIILFSPCTWQRFINIVLSFFISPKFFNTRFSSPSPYNKTYYNYTEKLKKWIKKHRISWQIIISLSHTFRVLLFRLVGRNEKQKRKTDSF